MARKTNAPKNTGVSKAPPTTQQQQGDAVTELAQAQNNPGQVLQVQQDQAAANQNQQVGNVGTELTPTNSDQNEVLQVLQSALLTTEQQVVGSTTDSSTHVENDLVQPSYVVNRDSFQHNGEPYGMGDAIAIDDEKQLNALLKLGAIIPAEAADAAESN